MTKIARRAGCKYIRRSVPARRDTVPVRPAENLRYHAHHGCGVSYRRRNPAADLLQLYRSAGDRVTGGIYHGQLHFAWLRRRS